MTDLTHTGAASSPTASVAPHLVSQIEDAATRGTISNISRDLAAAAQLFHLDAQPVEKVNDLLSRQYLDGTNVTFVKWTAKKGAVIQLIHHVNEQVTWFTKGLAEVYSQGEKFIMRTGDIMVLPPNVPHEFLYLEDTIDIDIFAPVRQNWLDGAATYLDLTGNLSAPRAEEA
jgi:quercetin dioxygenase-like cupin family protein